MFAIGHRWAWHVLWLPGNAVQELLFLHSTLVYAQKVRLIVGIRKQPHWQTVFLREKVYHASVGADSFWFRLLAEWGGVSQCNSELRKGVKTDISSFLSVSTLETVRAYEYLVSPLCCKTSLVY